jgi:hypothetical protein
MELYVIQQPDYANRLYSAFYSYLRRGALAALALAASGQAYSQAVVNETKETALLYVDGTNGSDANPGSQASPFQTIGAAVTAAEANNLKNVGTKVKINPGIYREQIVISGQSGQTSLPMTFQAATPGTVIVSGAVPFKNWNQYQPNPAMFTSAWPYQWGLCAADGGSGPQEGDIVERREMIFVNGVPMTQVLSLAQMIFPGTFFVDEVKGLVYVWPPAGVDMTKADVEVATLGNLLTIANAGGVPNGVVFRGIAFAYANSCHTNSAVVVSSGLNILFDNDAFVWNNAIGVSFSNPVAQISVTNSMANHNGAMGIQTFQVKNDLLQNVEASYNNWRGALGAYYTSNSAGIYSFSGHGNTWKNLRSVYNQTYAIHWDTDNQASTATGIFSAANLSGPLNEKNEGPTNVSGSDFCSSHGLLESDGFTILNSENTTLSGSLFYGSDTAQLVIAGPGGGSSVQNWETGQQYNLHAGNTSFQNNTVVAGQGEVAFMDDLGGSDWTAFVSTLTSDFNTWWNPTTTSQFVTPYPQDGTVVDFPGWQSGTGQDTHSVFQSPSGNAAAACAVTADAPDFWLIADQPQVTTDISGTASITMPSVSLSGFSGKLTLATVGLLGVPGLQGVLSPSSMAPSRTATLSLTASQTTPPGTYPFTVLANSANVTHAVSLSVTVPPYQVWVTPSSLTFKGQPLGKTSPSQSVTLTNIMSSVLAIGTIQPSTDFFETDNCGTALNPGASCTIQISFTPQGLRKHNGSLTISDSAGNSPQVVGLTGTVVGSGAAVTLSWTASTSPGVVGYNLYRGTTTGGPYTKRNSSLLTGTTYTDTTGTSGTHFYVATAVDSSGRESSYSNQVQAVVP